MYIIFMFEFSFMFSSSYEKFISFLWVVEENKIVFDDLVIFYNKLKMWNGDINVSGDVMVYFLYLVYM